MRAFLWIALGLLVWGGEAAAQIAPGRSGTSTATPSTNTKPFQQLQAFGACLARTHRKAALDLVATVPNSSAESKALRKLVAGEHSVCLSGGSQMAMPGVFARGAVAEGLLRSEGVPEELRLTVPSPAEVRDLHGAARCYTSGHRGEVEKLLQTKPGGAEEDKAVVALWDELRTCMPNFKVRMNPPWVRFLLAEALLRVAPNTIPSGQ